MFKLVVLFAVLALASAKPYAPLAYSTYGYAPAAVSHQSRVDVVSPAVAAYSAPAVAAYSAPVVSAYSAAPVVSAYSAAPVVSAYSAAPVVSTYAAAPVVASELALPHGVPAIVTKATGTPLDTADVVVARNNHYVAKSLVAHGIHKRSAYAPIAYSGLVSHAAPAVSAYSTTVVNPGHVVAAPYARTVVAPYSNGLVTPYAHGVVAPYSHGVVAPISSYGVHAW